MNTYSFTSYCHMVFNPSNSSVFFIMASNFLVSCLINLCLFQGLNNLYILESLFSLLHTDPQSIWDIILSRLYSGMKVHFFLYVCAIDLVLFIEKTILSPLYYIELLSNIRRLCKCEYNSGFSILFHCCLIVYPCAKMMPP